MIPQFLTFADSGPLPQAPFAAAVVMPSILRPSIGHALRSVFLQEDIGPVQILIGVDRAPEDRQGLDALEAACAHRPPGCVVQVLWPGYSTSQRHGGQGLAKDGGVLRCVLTHLANAAHVAYLDDDNWWGPRHLAMLLRACEGHDWAHAKRWFVHPRSLRPAAVDEWESIGEGGLFAQRFGGFVDPNCLMIDKRACGAAIECWNRPLDHDPTQMTADRRVYAQLRTQKGRGTGEATAFYVARESDGLAPIRAQFMGEAWKRAGRLMG